MIALSEYDAIEGFSLEQEVLLYLGAAIADGDNEVILTAIANVGKAVGILRARVDKAEMTIDRIASIPPIYPASIPVQFALDYLAKRNAR